MGAIVVRCNKDARLGEEEKNTPQANLLMNAVSKAMRANKTAKWRGLLLGGGGARSLIDNHTATLLASRAASSIRPFWLVVAGHPGVKIDGRSLGGSYRPRIAQVPRSRKSSNITHGDPVNLH
jgi:hypothetical protein